MSTAEPATIVRVQVARPTMSDLRSAVLALRGVLVALEWIDDGLVHDVDPEQIATTRAELLGAGVQIADMMAERF